MALNCGVTQKTDGGFRSANPAHWRKRQKDTERSNVLAEKSKMQAFSHLGSTVCIVLWGDLGRERKQTIMEFDFVYRFGVIKLSAA